MRLFYGLRLPSEALHSMEQLQNQLRAQFPRARFPAPETFHVTLAFLGDTPVQRLDAAKRVVNALLPAPLDLQVSHWGSFPQEKGEVLWLGLDPSPELDRLHRLLAHRLQEAGFPLESRRFQPHVTLARQVPFASPDTPRKLPAFSPFPLPCETVSLLRSHLLPQGARYEELACCCSKLPV